MAATTGVVVIGGGPAGCACAMTLARNDVPTVLVDRSDGEVMKIGETLPPSARATLEGLGLWGDFLAGGHLPCYSNRSAWGSARVQTRDFIFDPFGPGWHLD